LLYFLYFRNDSAIVAKPGILPLDLGLIAFLGFSFEDLFFRN